MTDERMRPLCRNQLARNIGSVAGLGLVVAKQIAEDFGGRLFVHGAPGRQHAYAGMTDISRMSAERCLTISSETLQAAIPDAVTIIAPAIHGALTPWHRRHREAMKCPRSGP
jgi:hypothetical protein